MQMHHGDCKSNQVAVIGDMTEGSLNLVLLTWYKLLSRTWLQEMVIKSAQDLAKLWQENVLSERLAELVRPVFVQSRDYDGKAVNLLFN